MSRGPSSCSSSSPTLSFFFLLKLLMTFPIFVLSISKGSSFRAGSSLNIARMAVQSSSKTVSVSSKRVVQTKYIGLGGLFGGRTPTKAVKQDAIKVVTDIDDTVVSSGGVKIFGVALGGIDNLYKRGHFYPGGIQFVLELSNSLKKASTQVVNELPSNVAVLTARAKEFKFALALKPNGKLCSAFAKAGVANGVNGWGIGDVYYGSVKEWILQHRKGLRKMQNFEIMMNGDDALDGHEVHRKYIIIGDTGEKDEEAAERAAMKYPDRLRAVFMHQVYDIKTKDSQVRRATRKVNGVPFYYFRTYVGAATTAYRNKMISKEALKRVTEQAVANLKTLDEQISGKSEVNPIHRLSKKKQLESQEERWREIIEDANECAFLNPIVERK